MKYPLLILASLLFLNTSPAQNFEIDTELFASGLNQSIGLENAGDDRLFAIEQNGTVAIIASDGTVQSTRFLDINGRVGSGGERGLLGLAFHPDYANNGFFYVNYTDNSGDTVISRFSVDPNNPDEADEASELELLTFSQPFGNHNGGDITFGPDDMLYIATGDGGSGGDPGDRAQDLDELLGKILRLDVDIAAPYIPSDNPFVNDGDANTLGEIWAYGLRNPFRISFDSDNDDFWIADVGQNEFEEVNKVENNPAGINYGWRCFEGNSNFDMSGDCPSDTSELEFPIVDYPHTNGRFSVTGGRVYRGTEFSNLQGIYIFSDFVSGELASIDQAGNLEFINPSSGGSFAGFGVDINNVLYAVSRSGSIYKIVDNEDLSVGENQFAEMVTVYPNPASQEFFVELQSASAVVSVFNLRGQQVLTARVSNNEAVNSSGLSSGLYIVSIEDSGNRRLKKLVISN